MPRRDACWPPRCWAGMTSVSRAMPAMSWPARASRIPWAWHCRKTRSPAKATTWRPATGRSAIPGPPARATNICRRMRRWLCWPASFTNCGPAGCGASLSFRRWRFPSSASCGNGWWPSRAQGLFARLAGVGRRAQAVLDGGGRRFHIACPGCRRRARRIHLPRPGGAGTGRLRPGGAMDGLAAAIQPRHAGRALPSDVVRGGECDQRARPGAAAGGAGRVPQGAGRTVYSALALAASAKMTEQRAQAAEAIARLADVGLLDPAPFAEQIAAHLADGFALAGRLAQTLADASSISALAGCRALQTLEALLPRLVDADGKPMAPAAKLIELAARLSNDYGMPIALPATLAARRKGASVLAVTLRSLETVARATPCRNRRCRRAALTRNSRSHDDLRKYLGLLPRPGAAGRGRRELARAVRRHAGRAVGRPARGGRLAQAAARDGARLVTAPEFRADPPERAVQRAPGRAHR